jgi:hypothetical protein
MVATSAGSTRVQLPSSATVAVVPSVRAHITNGSFPEDHLDEVGRFAASCRSSHLPRIGVASKMTNGTAVASNSRAVGVGIDDPYPRHVTRAHAS